jgi:hypothetical protein
MIPDPTVRFLDVYDDMRAAVAQAGALIDVAPIVSELARRKSNGGCHAVQVRIAATHDGWQVDVQAWEEIV